MANNYTQFSTGISHLTPAEAKWAKEKLTEAGRAERDYLGLLSDGPPREEPLNVPYVDEDGCMGFNWELGDVMHTESAPWSTFLWLYGEENGNVETTAEFIKCFLAQFRPNDCLAVTWASTCSKMWVDEFSGGGVFITAKKITYMNADYWCERQKRAFKAKQEKQTAKKKPATKAKKKAK